MSNKKPFEYKIAEIYSRKTVDVMMVAWVEALRSKTSISVSAGIRDYFNYFQINEDDYSFDSARTIYTGLKKALDEWDEDNKFKKRPDF